MPDNLKYPRFGGDSILVVRATMPCCECCLKNATHRVTVEITFLKEKSVDVCPLHVGQARRFHTFEKFLKALATTQLKGATNESDQTGS